MGKFGIGTKVNRSGYRGIIVGLRGSQREVRLGSGRVIVDAGDLKYWNKKK